MTSLMQPNSPKPNHEDFETMMEETWTKIQELSRLKGGEYAGDVNRLENFDRNARDCGTSPELVWRIYAGKHWDAITQYINDKTNGKERQRLELITGRIDDLILYSLLLKFMVLRGSVDG